MSRTRVGTVDEARVILEACLLLLQQQLVKLFSDFLVRNDERTKAADWCLVPIWRFLLNHRIGTRSRRTAALGCIYWLEAIRIVCNIQLHDVGRAIILLIPLLGPFESSMIIYHVLSAFIFGRRLGSCIVATNTSSLHQRALYDRVDLYFS